MAGIPPPGAAPHLIPVNLPACWHTLSPDWHPTAILSVLQENRIITVVRCTYLVDGLSEHGGQENRIITVAGCTGCIPHSDDSWPGYLKMKVLIVPPDNSFLYMTVMQPAETLRSLLRRMDKKSYGHYGDIRGRYRFDTFVLCIDHVQKDPFASPSRVRVLVDSAAAGFASDMWNTPSRRRGLCDYLTRAFCQAAEKSSIRSGSGKSGLIAMDTPGQEILDRTSVSISDAGVEGRFVVGLPAFGRRIAGREAENVFFERLPAIVAASLVARAHDLSHLYHHIGVAEDADLLRGLLWERGLVAFVADGAVLPRESGASDRPMRAGDVVPFATPPALRVTIDLPNAGALTGMGIPAGVTLIVGGGYHGKSTLLDAITAGVYTHIPGDGREYVVSNPAR